MNLYAIKAIYLFELARTWRTLLQSIATSKTGCVGLCVVQWV